jgi:PleD family two-component response regulator
MKNEKPGRSTGIGLNNLNERLALLYPGKHELSSRIENNRYIMDLSPELDERNLEKTAMTSTCIIIDDEPVAIEVIKTHLQHLEDFNIEATFTNPIKAAGYLGENQIDLIFMDIEMPVLSGFELLSSLPEPPKVIITTAHRDYAPEAFNM